MFCTSSPTTKDTEALSVGVVNDRPAVRDTKALAVAVVNDRPATDTGALVSTLSELNAITKVN